MSMLSLKKKRKSSRCCRMSKSLMQIIGGANGRSNTFSRLRALFSADRHSRVNWTIFHPGWTANSLL